MSRELPPGASTQPLTRERNRTVAAPLLLAPIAIAVAFAPIGSDRVRMVVGGGGLALFVLALVQLNRPHHLLRVPASVVHTEDVAVTGRRRAHWVWTLIAALTRAWVDDTPYVEIHRSTGLPTWHAVIAGRAELRRIPRGTTGTWHEYDDGAAVLVVGAASVWCDATPE